MSRFTMVLAAAVATAMLVIGVSALDAVGADPPTKASDNDLTATLADCLRDRGIPVPAVTGAELDHWLRTQRIPDATGRACKEAVAPPQAEVRAAPSAGVKQLHDCLTSKGFDVPTDPVALKEWIGHQTTREALGALKQCGLVMKPDPQEKPAPCGAAPAKPSDHGKASRPDSGEATPET